MTGPKVDIGRDLVCFVAKQATYQISDVAGESYPEAADALRVITGSAGGTIPFAMREDKFGTATAVPGIRQKRTAEGSLEGYVMPSGTRTTAPDADELLTGGGWSKVDLSASSTTVAGGASTQTRVDLTSSAGLQVGGCIIVERGPGSGEYEMRRISGVDTAGTDVTVEPALTFPPSAGAEAKGGIAYIPNDDRDTAEDSLALWMLNNNSADRIGGWAPGSFGFTLGGEDAARVTVSGTGRRHDRLFTTQLDGAILVGDPTMTVQAGLASAGNLENTYWQLGDEVVKVTQTTGTTWSIDRAQLGSVASGHSDGAAVTPYRPVGIYAGEPVPATSGQAVMTPVGQGFPIEIQINNASLDCGLGLAYREDELGDNYKAAGYVMSQREIRATLSGWTLKDSNMIAASFAWLDENVSGNNSQQMVVGVVTGQTEGLMFGWVAPSLRMEDLSLDRGAEEVTLDLTGMCEGTAAGADEIVLMFG